MGDKKFHRGFAGPGFTLGTWVCTHDHRGPGPEQWTALPVINVVLEGMYARHLGRTTIVADPTVALLGRTGESWRSSHPTGTCGDRGVFVLIDPEVAGPLPADRVLPLSGRTWLAWRAVALTGDVELATALVAEVVHRSALPQREPGYVARARRLLAARLRDPPDLPALAAEIGVSPWHLCRTFRAVTGTTPRAYAERLRLAEASHRIGQGKVDLTELAFDLGFSSHSHLTARFRAILGVTPGHLGGRARS